MQSYDEKDDVTQKEFSVLKNGGTFWLFSIMLVIVLGVYVHFFMVKQNNFLNHEIDFKFFTLKLNYVVFYALIWVSLLFFVLFN